MKQAAALLAANEEAKLLAGGHSLIPVMKQRLASPDLIVDLSKIEGLSGIEVTPRTVTIKAMTKHRDVANSKELLEVMPALASVPDSIGDPACARRPAPSAVRSPTTIRMRIIRRRALASAQRS